MTQPLNIVSRYCDENVHSSRIIFFFIFGFLCQLICGIVQFLWQYMIKFIWYVALIEWSIMCYFVSTSTTQQVKATGLIIPVACYLVADKYWVTSPFYTSLCCVQWIGLFNVLHRFDWGGCGSSLYRKLITIPCSTASGFHTCRARVLMISEQCTLIPHLFLVHLNCPFHHVNYPSTFQLQSNPMKLSLT
jgi:hypothetical protein